MNTCPTCKAKLKNTPICRRCKTDLNKALEAADRAKLHLRLANQAYIDGRLKAMQYHAGRSFSLLRTAQGGRMLACAAFLKGDYDLALKSWHRMRKMVR
jgi:hypothetical protein